MSSIQEMCTYIQAVFDYNDKVFFFISTIQTDGHEAIIFHN